MADVHTRALTAKHQITPTSRCCLPAWQPNPGRGSTYRSDKNCLDNRLQLFLSHVVNVVPSSTPWDEVDGARR